MTGASRWLAERTPPPPEPVARRLRQKNYRGETVSEALATAAIEELRQARATPGRVRASAYHLLAADALLTYACEAALDEADACVELSKILRSAAASDL